MKKLITLLALLCTSIAFGATTVPVQLLNPAGSTAGQAVVSTGPTSAPGWGSVSTAALTGIVPVANGGTGFSTYTTGAVLVGATGGGLTTVSTSSSGLPLISQGTGFVPIFTPLTIAGGGTSATTASQALTNLGGAALAGSATQTFSVAAGTTANQAVNFGQVLGVGQTWTDVHTSRSLNTAFTNTTGKPIEVCVAALPGVATGVIVATMGSVQLLGTAAPAVNTQTSISFIVPNGVSYTVSVTGGGSPSVSSWAELR